VSGLLSNQISENIGRFFAFIKKIATNGGALFAKRVTKRGLRCANQLRSLFCKELIAIFALIVKEQRANRSRSLFFMSIKEQGAERKKKSTPLKKLTIRALLLNESCL